MKREYYIYGGIGLAAAVVIYVTINRRIKAKDFSKHLEKIEGTPSGDSNGGGGSGIYGDYRELRSSKAFDPKYYQKVVQKSNKPNEEIADSSLVAKAGKKIYNAKGYFNDDEEAVLSGFSMLNSKVEVSLLADWFRKEKDEDLYQYINGFLSAGVMNDIRDIIQGLPDK